MFRKWPHMTGLSLQSERGCMLHCGFSNYNTVEQL